MHKKEIINIIDNFNYNGFVLKLEDVSFNIPSLIEEEVEKSFLYNGPNSDLYFAIYPELNRYIYIFIFKKKLIILSKSIQEGQRYIYTTSSIVFDVENSKFIKVNKKNKDGNILTSKTRIALLEKDGQIFLNTPYARFKKYIKDRKSFVTNMYMIRKKGSYIKLLGFNTSKLKQFSIVTNDGINIGTLNNNGILSSGKIDINSLFESDKIHNPVGLSIDGKTILFPINIRGAEKIYNHQDKSMRFKTIGGNLRTSVIPLSKENLLLNRIKLKFAHVISYISKKDKILMFEKFSNNAQESSIRVFEEMIKNKEKNTYFILDKSSEQYDSLKKKYENKIIEKNTFKHYYYFFRASYAVSSELPTHIFNDRILNNNVLDRCKKIKFVFLQHGIMLGKPIFNPMALGFHKKNTGFNIIKTVVSSQLEAEEFYKMGYNDDDLMFTGLATLDYAYLNPGADKIVYMPTYRYWEEAFIYSDKIEETTYYQDIIDMIEIFKENNLLDRLLIVPHNKFSEYIYNHMKEYTGLISPSPTEALKQGEIFITDYSSAIYDAQFRGAYPIFYWEHRDELIRNYKARPTLDEEIASGPCVYSKEELIAEVQNAIMNDYKLADEYKEKYLKINQFIDRENTKRICKEVKKLLKE